MSDHTSNSCYVYVFQALSGAIKIGVAKDVATRLNTFQAANPDPIRIVTTLEFASSEIAFAVEAALHQRYARYRLSGEWFSVDAADLMLDLRLITAVAKLVRGIQVETRKVRPSSKPAAENLSAVVTGNKAYWRIRAITYEAEYRELIESLRH